MIRSRNTEQGVEFFIGTEAERKAFLNFAERLDRVERALGLYATRKDPVLPLVVRSTNPVQIIDQLGVVMGTLDLVWLINRDYEQRERNSRDFDL